MRLVSKFRSVWRSCRFVFSVRVSVRFFCAISARVFALCVVVAVGVCRAFIGLILVLQSVGRIFTVAL